MQILFCSFPRENEEKEKLVKAAFGRLWRRFAEDVTDESQIAEYNSIKHGLRVQAGGVEVAIGAEDVPGVPAPAENMRVLGTSDFGNTFYIAQKLHPKDFRIERQSINWCPMKFVYGLQLIAMSINNVVSFAKILKGVERNSVSFQCPIDQTLFEMPWKKGPEVTRVNLNSIIEKAMVDPTTAQEIKDSYI